MKQPIIIALIGLVTAMLFGTKAYPQHPDFLFEHTYPYPIPHTLKLESPKVFTLQVSSENDSEQFYLVSVSDGKNWLFYETDSIAYPPVVYKVSAGGEVIGELALGFEGRYSIVYKLFVDPTDAKYCLAVGITHDNDLHYDRPFIAKFDHNLNLLWQNEVELPEEAHQQLNCHTIMDSDGNIIFWTIPFDFFSSHPEDNYLLYFRITSNGEFDAMLQYPYLCNWSTGGGRGDLFEFQDGSRDYGHIVEEMTGEQRYMIRINRDLELISRQWIPDQIIDQHPELLRTYFLSIDYVATTVPLLDGSVILGGMGFSARTDYEYNVTYDEIIGFVRFDQGGDWISYGSAGQGELGQGNDSIKSIQGVKCSDFVGDDAFYFVYSVGEPNGFGYDWINCFVVAKMDFDGHVIWQRYWDRYYPEYGMKVYYPFSLTTTSDDGCLVSGYCYYSDIYGPNPSGSDPEIFLLKFFSDGSFSIPEAEAFLRPYMFYPNPAQGQLHLQYSPDVQPKQVELYDLQGRLVRSQRQGLESLDMQGLASGQYLMKVTLEDGKSFTDKVVKE